MLMATLVLLGAVTLYVCNYIRTVSKEHLKSLDTAFQHSREMVNRCSQIVIVHGVIVRSLSTVVPS